MSRFSDGRTVDQLWRDSYNRQQRQIAAGEFPRQVATQVGPGMRRQEQEARVHQFAPRPTQPRPGSIEAMRQQPEFSSHSTPASRAEGVVDTAEAQGIFNQMGDFANQEVDKVRPIRIEGDYRPDGTQAVRSGTADPIAYHTQDRVNAERAHQANFDEMAGFVGPMQPEANTERIQEMYRTGRYIPERIGEHERPESGFARWLWDNTRQRSNFDERLPQSESMSFRENLASIPHTVSNQIIDAMSRFGNARRWAANDSEINPETEAPAFDQIFNDGRVFRIEGDQASYQMSDGSFINMDDLVGEVQGQKDAIEQQISEIYEALDGADVAEESWRPATTSDPQDRVFAAEDGSLWTFDAYTLPDGNTITVDEYNAMLAQDIALREQEVFTLSDGREIGLEEFNALWDEGDFGTREVESGGWGVMNPRAPWQDIQGNRPWDSGFWSEGGGVQLPWGEDGLQNPLENMATNEALPWAVDGALGWAPWFAPGAAPVIGAAYAIPASAGYDPATYLPEGRGFENILQPGSFADTDLTESQRTGHIARAAAFPLARGAAARARMPGTQNPWFHDTVAGRAVNQAGTSAAIMGPTGALTGNMATHGLEGFGAEFDWDEGGNLVYEDTPVHQRALNLFGESVEAGIPMAALGGGRSAARDLRAAQALRQHPGTPGVLRAMENNPYNVTRRADIESIHDAAIRSTTIPRTMFRKYDASGDPLAPSHMRSLTPREREFFSQDLMSRMQNAPRVEYNFDRGFGGRPPAPQRPPTRNILPEGAP